MFITVKNWLDREDTINLDHIISISEIDMGGWIIYLRDNRYVQLHMDYNHGSAIGELLGFIRPRVIIPDSLKLSVYPIDSTDKPV